MLGSFNQRTDLAFDHLGCESALRVVRSRVRRDRRNHSNDEPGPGSSLSYASRTDRGFRPCGPLLIQWEPAVEELIRACDVMHHPA